MRHYPNNNSPEWLDWTYIVCMSGLFCALIAGAIARSAPTPVTRVGTFCPIGYYRTGPYCSPLPTQKHQAAERLNSTCPLGSYTEGNYCKVH